MGERLTIEELRVRYDGEWVALDEVEADESEAVTAGRVFAHGPDSDSVYDEVERLRPREFAVLCFKSLQEGWGLAL